MFSSTSRTISVRGASASDRDSRWPRCSRDPCPQPGESDAQLDSRNAEHDKTVMRRLTRISYSLPHNGGAHSAPASERRGAAGPRERPSRGPGRSPGLVGLAVIIPVARGRAGTPRQLPTSQLPTPQKDNSTTRLGVGVGHWELTAFPPLFALGKVRTRRSLEPALRRPISRCATRRDRSTLRGEPATKPHGTPRPRAAAPRRRARPDRAGSSGRGSS